MIFMLVIGYLSIIVMKKLIYSSTNRRLIIFARAFDRERGDSDVSPRSIECNGLVGGGINGDSTLLLRQQNPDVSPANFNASQ